MSWERIRELRTERRTVLEQANALLPSDGESMTPEAETEFEARHARAGELLAEIERYERQVEAQAQQQELELRARESRGTQVGSEGMGGEDPAPEQGADDAEARRDAFRSYLRFGMGGMSEGDRARLARNQELPQEARALSSGMEGSVGVLVPAESMAPLVEAQREFGAVTNANVTVYRTTHGRAIPIPTSNDTAEEGQRVGENQAVKETALRVDAKELGAYDYSSRIVLVPLTLTTDTEFGLESYLFSIFGRRIARTVNREMTDHKGSSGPEPILANTKLGHTTAAASEFDWTDFVELEGSVDRAYRSAGAEYMMSDTTFTKVRRLKDDNNRPLFMPGGVEARSADKISAYNLVINNHLPDFAAGAKCVLFGAFRNYAVRQVVPPTVMRLTERYAEYGQVAFLMFERWDGKLIDAGTHPIKHMKVKA